MRLLFEFTTSISYYKIQHFAPNLTFKPSQRTAPYEKKHLHLTKYYPCHKQWYWTIAKYSCHGKWHWNFKKCQGTSTKYCTRHGKSHWNLTKYCTCHESDIRPSPSTTPDMKVTLELHQVLHLPRKMTLRNVIRMSGLPLQHHHENDTTNL